MKATLKPIGKYLRRLGLGWTLDKHVDEHGNVFRWRGWAEFNIGKPGRNEVGGINREAMYPIYDVTFLRLP